MAIIKFICNVMHTHISFMPGRSSYIYIYIYIYIYEWIIWWPAFNYLDLVIKLRNTIKRIKNRNLILIILQALAWWERICRFRVVRSGRSTFLIVCSIKITIVLSTFQPLRIYIYINLFNYYMNSTSCVLVLEMNL